MNGRVNIIIVDDDPKLRKTLSDILRAKGYAPATAATGQEALDGVERETPTVALIDLRLEDMSGLEVMKGIKGRFPDTECIVLTGYASQASAIEAINLGAYSYVQKPYDMEQLLVTIRRAVEKREAVETLRESEERFRAIFETAQDSIFIKNRALEYTQCNPAMEKLFGLPAAKLIGRTDDDLFGKEAGAHTREVDSRVLRGKIVEEEDTKPVKGVPTTFHVIKVPMRGKSGEIIGVCGVARDVTERKRAEEALQESEEQLRTLINAMPDFVCFKDGDGRWLNVNDASIRLFQLEGMNYRGKTDSELAELNGFLRDTFLTCEKTDANTWKERSIFREEETISHPDGIVRVFDVIKVPVFYPSGERKGLVVLGRDITERKRAEEEVRLQLITLAETVSRIFNLRNSYVATHQQETARLARAVGEKMGLDEDTLQDLYIGSLLHDIGKTAIPEGILRKPGKLTEAELGLVRTHPRQGYDILKDANLPSLVAELALHHHERLDGSGYPDGLKGDELSMEVRILAVCNVVNAMSLRHPYRPARSKQEITKEITNGKGTKYDPEVVDVLIGIIESGELELAG